jgi:hypothetical protein
MNQRPTRFRSFAFGPDKGIPVEFGADLPLCFHIKIQPPNLMKNPMLIPEKAIVPTPFQIAARLEEPAPEKTPGSGRRHLGEMMLNAKRLEAVLKAIVRRKKTGPRRVAGSRLEKRISINEGQMA